MDTEKNIGQIIKDILDQRNMTVIEFADKIGMTRNNAYNIFERQSIDTDLLKKIGQLLEYDFFLFFLEEKTIQNIKHDNSKKTKIFIELELDDKDISNVGVYEKALKVLKK